MRVSVWVPRVLCLLSLSLLPHATVRADGIDHTHVRLGMGIYLGNACPPGSLTMELNNEASAVQVHLQRFVADLVSGPLGDRAYGDCQINFAIRHPKDWQFTLPSVVFNGFSYLTEGTGLAMEVTHGMPNQRAIRYANFGRQAIGPVPARPFQETITHADRDLIWSPCDNKELTTMTLAFRAQVQASALRRAYLDFGSQEFGEAAQMLNLRWRPCPTQPSHAH